ncbi:MAG: threonine/serine exporter family protein [Flavobacteriales bacterium]|nr:threonine/serine exporter family protein [Flavobacteriales bacterium]NUQ15752.1 threonine/serine exporter family protein [Flavobacteriales bacterium]
MGTPATPVDRELLLRFLARLGQAELAAGNAAPFVERDLGLIARAHGVQGFTAFVLPTVLFLELDEGGQHKVDLATGPYRSGTLRFDQIEEVMVIAREARQGALGAVEGLQRLDAVWHWPHRYGAWGGIGGYMLTSLGVAVLLRPTPHGLALSTLLALVCALLLHAVRKRPAWSAVIPVVASFVLSAAVAYALHHGFPERATNLLIPPLITFLPGLTLTVAVIELAYSNTISGASRLVAGFAQLVLLAFGVLGGIGLFEHAERPVDLPAWPGRINAALPWLGVLLFALGLHLHQSSDRRSFGWMLVTTVAAYAAQSISGQLIQGASTAFFGAAAMTITALVIEFRFKGPPAIVTLLPAFWLLAPGSFGLRSVTGLAVGQGDVTDVFALLFAMTGIAMGSLIGAFVYGMALHPRSATWWRLDEP